MNAEQRAQLIEVGAQRLLQHWGWFLHERIPQPDWDMAHSAAEAVIDALGLEQVELCWGEDCPAHVGLPLYRFKEQT